MPKKVTTNRLNEFVEALSTYEGVAGNKSLREELNWDEDFYWKVQGKLIEEGRIVPGRGRGGSVRLVDQEPNALIKDCQAVSEYPDERSLYEPIADSIKTKWINRFGFDDHLLEQTHSRGSKDTGGTFTRPDLTAIGVRRYEFLPKRLEIVTFEIKAANSVGILGVLEALAHREAAHRSYVIYAIARDGFENAPEADRIVELSQRYGVGVVTLEDPTQIDTWDIVLDAVPNDPDPARLDRFLADLPSSHSKKQIHKWKD